MKISKNDLKRVKKLDLLSYYKNYDPDELIPMRNGTYRTKTHSSLKLSNGKWCWWREKIGGISALDYFIKVEGKTSSVKIEYLEYAIFLRNNYRAQKDVSFINLAISSRRI